MKISQTVAIVTGGASGMGRATVHHLAQLGAKVAIFDKNTDQANALAQETGCLAFTCDVTDEFSVISALEKAEKIHGIARICINCAGIVTAKRLVGRQGPLPLDEFEKTLRVNLTGTFNVMRLAVHAMLRHTEDETGSRGIVINTASIAAFEGQTGQVAYSASKGGIIAMTLPAARELSRFGIRVMAIAPGLVDTPLFAALPETARKSLSAAVPFPKRLAQPEEFARLVQHVIENDMLNGTVIRLDGGLRMQD